MIQEIKIASNDEFAFTPFILYKKEKDAINVRNS